MDVMIVIIISIVFLIILIPGYKMELKEYTKQLEKEKHNLQKEILSKVKDFEDFTGTSIDRIELQKIFGGKSNKSRVIEVKIKAEV